MKENNKLVVYHEGKPKYKINSGLLTRQDCWENLDKINAHHEFKLDHYKLINNTDSPATLKLLALEITEIEFRLQELWRFPKDAKFHRFWETPKCSCPKIDNEDAYPTGHYFVSSDCPLHA
jgi:hypothetical protein